MKYLLLTVIGLAEVASAQTASTSAGPTYPTRPVRVIVSVAPGGGTDTVGRSLAQKLSERLGQQFVIDNRPGAGGSIAVELTVRAAPDGYTLLFSSSTFVTNQLLYKSMALAFPDIISGQVHVAISSALTMLPHLRGGRVHALGVTSRVRMAALPEVPTIAEQGFAGFEVTQWYGMMAPAGTPLPLRLAVQGEMARALQLPEVRARLSAEGAEAVGNTPAEFAGRLKEEFVKWGRIIRGAGIKMD